MLLGVVKEGSIFVKVQWDEVEIIIRYDVLCYVFNREVFDGEMGNCLWIVSNNVLQVNFLR